MSTLDDIGVYLQDNGFGTLGETIFLGTIPPDAPGSGVQDAVLALFEVPGLPPLLIHDQLGPSVEQPVIQVRFRGAPYGYAAARTQAGDAFRLLASVANATINGVFYQQILALQGPFGLPGDEWNRPYVLFNVRCLRDGSVA